jgi:hypothetical protein
MLSFRTTDGMATCPRCKGHLTEDHRCPRSRGRIFYEVAFSGIAGAFGALLIASLIDPHGQMAMDAVMLILGALLGVALNWWIRG